MKSTIHSNVIKRKVSPRNKNSRKNSFCKLRDEIKGFEVKLERKLIPSRMNVNSSYTMDHNDDKVS